MNDTFNTTELAKQLDEMLLGMLQARLTTVMASDKFQSKLHDCVEATLETVLFSASFNNELSRRVQDATSDACDTVNIEDTLRDAFHDAWRSVTITF